MFVGAANSVCLIRGFSKLSFGGAGGVDDTVDGFGEGVVGLKEEAGWIEERGIGCAACGGLGEDVVVERKGSMAVFFEGTVSAGNPEGEKEAEVATPFFVSQTAEVRLGEMGAFPRIEDIGDDTFFVLSTPLCCVFLQQRGLSEEIAVQEKTIWARWRASG